LIDYYILFGILIDIGEVGLVAGLVVKTRFGGKRPRVEVAKSAESF